MTKTSPQSLRPYLLELEAPGNTTLTSGASDLLARKQHGLLQEAVTIRELGIKGKADCLCVRLAGCKAEKTGVCCLMGLASPLPDELLAPANIYAHRPPVTESKKKKRICCTLRNCTQLFLKPVFIILVLAGLTFS